MTPSQEQALQEIRKIALAHFNSFVMSARATVDDLDSTSDYAWISTGPYTDCIGLTSVLKIKLKRAWMDRHANEDPITGGPAP